MEGFADKVGFIWWIADLLRGDYKQSEYGKVILPLTVLRRLDCVLERRRTPSSRRLLRWPGRSTTSIRCYVEPPVRAFTTSPR